MSSMAIPIAAAGTRDSPADAAAPFAASMDFEATALSAACVRKYPATAPLLEATRTLTLLVKIEADGRPSATRIERSSGMPAFDDAVSACVLSTGRFAPRSGAGRTLAPWLRLVWYRTDDGR
jgi:TonB family protein